MTQNHPQRKNLRLPHYNYADEGAYYVTICTDHKLQILCNLAPPALEGNEPNCHLTPVGHTVEEMILAIPGIDKYVVMPNHIHMIVLNRPGDTALSRKMQYFKANVTRKLGRNIWQRNYYEHVIRDEQDYLTKWKYIDDNPMKWASDDYNC